MHRGRREHAHRLHAVSQQDLIQRQFADEFHGSPRTGRKRSCPEEVRAPAPIVTVGRKSRQSKHEQGQSNCLTVPKLGLWCGVGPRRRSAATWNSRRIAHVGAPAIVREAQRQPGHRPVAQDLGNDGGGRDRQGSARRRPPRSARRRSAAAAGCHRPEPGQAGRQAATARHIASSDACKMLAARSRRPRRHRRRFRHGPKRAMPGRPPDAARPTASWSRSSSAASRRGTPVGNTTAAATTGPASGPRPTSSTPATRPPARFSSEKFGTPGQVTAGPESTSRRYAIRRAAQTDD